jgi:hypothetical protein
MSTTTRPTELPATPGSGWSDARKAAFKAAMKKATEAGKFRTEKKRLAAIANAQKAKAANTGKPVTEQTRKLISISKVGKPMSRSGVEKQRAKLKGHEWSRETIEARRKSNLGKVRDVAKSPWSARGPQNQHAITCEIRSPENVVYFVRNVTDWVRRHAHLFKPEDVTWKKRPGSAPTCRALKGILKLREARDPRGSWKGWTLVSDVEFYGTKGNDLLGRNYVPCPNR